MIDIEPSIENKIVKKPNNKLYATGKRKNSIAKVWLKPNGKGEIKVNKKDCNKYFSRSLLNMLVKKPFEVINNNNFDVNIREAIKDIAWLQKIVFLGLDIVKHIPINH